MLPSAASASRLLIPAGGAILMVTGAVWVLPEVADSFGWTGAVMLVAAALLVLGVVDRYVYPVCPSCAPQHDHHSCATRLHGFGAPVLAALALHNLFDGWMVALGESAAYHGGHSLSAGVLAHKVPECLAFGIILRAASPSKRTAIVGALSVQLFTLAGAALQRLTQSWFSPPSVAVLLAISGATFLYLGFHSLHGEWKRRSASVPG